MGTLFGQVSQTTGQAGSTDPQTTLQTQTAAYEQEQEALRQERQNLIDQGATSAQLAAWREQKAAQFAALQQQAQAMATASALQLRPTTVQPNIPANASPTLTDFLTTQANLANARAQIHNQLIQSIPSGAGADQIGQMQAQERQLFQQQYAVEIQAQAQRTQTLAEESARTPIPVPPPLVIPSDATPQMAAFLTARDQLLRSRIQLRNEYATADPATRQAAMQQWRQQNAALIQQMQQEAQTLAQAASSESSNTPN